MIRKIFYKTDGLRTDFIFRFDVILGGISYHNGSRWVLSLEYKSPWDLVRQHGCNIEEIGVDLNDKEVDLILMLEELKR